MEAPYKPVTTLKREESILAILQSQKIQINTLYDKLEDRVLLKEELSPQEALQTALDYAELEKMNAYALCGIAREKADEATFESYKKHYDNMTTILRAAQEADFGGLKKFMQDVTADQRINSAPAVFGPDPSLGGKARMTRGQTLAKNYSQIADLIPTLYK